MRKLVLLLGALVLTPSAPAAIPTVTVQVSVRATNRGPVPDAWVAFVPPDRPAWRPFFETIARNGVASAQLPPGRYRVYAGSRGFQETWRSVDVKSNATLAFDLRPSEHAEGVVVDAEGKPVVGVMVSNLRAVGPIELGQSSALARQYFAPDWVTRTDRLGHWTLSGRDDAAIAVRFEAEGFAPTTEFRRSKEASPPRTGLAAGGSLRLTLDRADPGAFVTLRRDAPRGTDQELELEPLTLTRAADAIVLRWPSLKAGTYRVIAESLDPKRFADPRLIGTVTVRDHETSELRVALPPFAAPAPEFVTLFLPGRPADELATIDAMVSTRTGPEEVRHSLEDASGGTLVYVETTARPADVYLLTRDSIIAPDTRIAVDANAPIPTLKSGRADATIQLHSNDTSQMPRQASAGFSGCAGDARYRFVAPLAPDGALHVPYPVVCRSLVARAIPFEPIVIRADLATHEKRSFGPYSLKLGGSADLHVVRSPTGTAAPNAVVRAHLDGVLVAEEMTDGEGHVILRGLPADRDLTIEAQENASDATGSIEARVSAEQVATLEVTIPLPATLSVAPQLSRGLRTRFPDARIHSVALDREDDPSHRSRRTIDLATSPSALFQNVRPGRWHILVLVEAAGTIQSLPAGDVDLKAGDLQQVDPEVDPAVFDGRVVRAGKALEAQVGFGDPPAIRSVTRFARTDAQGRFTVLLPSRGTYRVTVTPIEQPDARIAVGEIDFNDTRPIIIAVPSGALIARVKEHGEPVPNAVVTARLRRTTAYETVAEVVRNTKTNLQGEAHLAGLLDGRWLVEAAVAGSRAETSVLVNGGNDEEVVKLDLQRSSALKGVVRRANNAVVADAGVHCLLTGPSGIPQIATTQSDAGGRFAIELPSPPPAMLRCGVITTAGELATFMLGPTESADFVLPSDTASLVIPAAGPRAMRDADWLVTRDGRLFNLGWADAKLGTFGSSLTLSHVPAGSWKVVRTTTAEEWMRLATAGGDALAAVTEFRLEVGKTFTVRLPTKQP